ncbi:unnamed protein product [Bursaphelenchus okinawaensis]|uniref:Thioesterase domain-containing protein n=1 Tax=Bursaphelenchus okinawaensis TaxID=465554 RepID=A0A811JU70_9BILA|nr:unnamed protein product [Bursaphelenchus okinawaensis]CAG9083999.1 unnamed protein product [Bursaphelenchus okinawaensis]
MPPPAGIRVMSKATKHKTPDKHPWHAFTVDGEDTFSFSGIHILRHGWGYGGNTASLALYAAFKTVPSNMIFSSFHSQFIRPVTKSTVKVVVERCKDGVAEVLRLVKLFCDDKLAYTMDCRFCVGGMNFKSAPKTPTKMPQVCAPEQCQTSFEVLQDYMKSGGDMTNVRNITFPDDQPHIDHRLPEGVNGIIGYSEERYEQTIWSRYKLSNYDSDRNFSELIVTNLSDLGMCYAAALMFPNESFSRIASLSLSIWFHCTDFLAEDFLLQRHVVVGHNHNRSLISGQIWSRNGKLIATTMQEAIVEPESITKAKY